MRFWFGLAIAVAVGCGSGAQPETEPAAIAAATSTASAASGSGGQGGTTASVGAGGSSAGGSYVGVDPLAGIAAVEEVATGLAFAEGPCWFAAIDTLRFSDVQQSRIDELTDAVDVWRENSGGSNGLAIAPDGRILACEGLNRQVTISDPVTPSFSVVASTYQGKRFNAPNDAIVRSDGTIYFTDPDYGLAAADHEIGFNGVYRVATDGTVSLVSDALVLPNGIALSPDETTLYVNDEGNAALYAFAVAADASTGPGQKILTTTPHPDGMAIDDAGNLYLATQAGIDVYGADLKPWGTIAVPQQPANCTFGDTDRKTLFITARTGLYRVHLNVPGLP